MASSGVISADPLVAGHWLPRADGTGGPNDATGQASIVSGTDERGARMEPTIFLYKKSERSFS